MFIGAGAAAVVGTGAGLNGISAIALAHGLTSWSLPLRMAASQAPVSGRLHHSHGEHCDDHRPGQLVRLDAQRPDSLAEAAGFEPLHHECARLGLRYRAAARVATDRLQQARARSALSARHDSREDSGTPFADAKVRILPPQPASKAPDERTAEAAAVTERNWTMSSAAASGPRTGRSARKVVPLAQQVEQMRGQHNVAVLAACAE